MNSNDDEYQPTDEDLKLLREWVKKMPHIIQDYDDAFLTRFIIGCKGSLQKTKIVLERFSSLGQRFPEFFGHLDIYDRTTRECVKDMMLILLPKRLKNGLFIYIIKLDFKDGESKKTNLMEFLRYWLMTFYVRIWGNEPMGKYITIFDWSNLSVGQAREITPVMIINIVKSMKSLPIRTGDVYNINVPPPLQWMIMLMKSLDKKKLGERLHFMNSMDALYEKVPKELLPQEYGGDEDDMRTLHNRFIKKIESYRKQLVEEHMKMRKLDPLRPKNIDSEDMVGTFKALNVD